MMSSKIFIFFIYQGVCYLWAHMFLPWEDWATRLDKFLEFDERDVLQNAGKISAKIAKDYAESEFEKYRIIQDRLFESDFDKELKALTKGMESQEKQDK